MWNLFRNCEAKNWPNKQTKYIELPPCILVSSQHEGAHAQHHLHPLIAAWLRTGIGGHLCLKHFQKTLFILTWVFPYDILDCLLVPQQDGEMKRTAGWQLYRIYFTAWGFYFYYCSSISNLTWRNGPKIIPKNGPWLFICHPDFDVSKFFNLKPGSADVHSLAPDGLLEGYGWRCPCNLPSPMLGKEVKSLQVYGDRHHPINLVRKTPVLLWLNQNQTRSGSILSQILASPRIAQAAVTRGHLLHSRASTLWTVSWFWALTTLILSYISKLFCSQL